MHLFTVLALFLPPAVALAQSPGAPPPFMPPSPQTPPAPAAPYPGAAQQGYGGCYGCSYSGDYFGSGYGYAPPVRRPAPPPRIQGQWRNGLWYY